MLRRDRLQAPQPFPHAATGFLLLGLIGLLAAARPAPAIVLPDDFSDELVVSGLSQPVGFDFFPDGRMLIIEQKSGRVRLVVGGSADTTLTIPDVRTSGNERGLLGVVIDSQWPARPYVYFYFDQTPSNTIYIVMYEAVGDLTDPNSSNLTLTNRYNILTDIPDAASNHNGGTLRFGPDSLLYASVGDDADQCAAQDTTSLKGVILRLDVSSLPGVGPGPPAKGTITPSDNPYKGVDANAGLVWAYGFRNPFRFHIDHSNGRLYVADVGQTQYEEVSEVFGDDNFGWPAWEGPNFRPGTGCQPATHTLPIGGYDRSGFSPATIISATLYRPNVGGVYNFPPEYHGDYFYAEYYQGFVQRLENNGGGWGIAPAVPGQPTLMDWAIDVRNVSDWQVGPDGGLYYCKQFSTASIRRIVYTANTGGVGGGAPRPPVLSAHPNPYHRGAGKVTIAFTAETDGPVTIDIFDTSGRRVRRLASEVQSGNGSVRWDGSGETGAPMPYGVYFVRMKSGATESTTRVVLTDS